MTCSLCSNSIWSEANKLHKMPSYASLLAGVVVCEQRYLQHKCADEEVYVFFDRWTHETGIVSINELALVEKQLPSYD